MFKIVYERNHYTVYKNGVFYCTADNKHEAEREIGEAYEN